MRKVHNKLVRDKIPDICRENGAMPTTRTINDDEDFLALLHDKLDEETAELRKTPNIEELADVLEVLHTIADELGVSPGEVETYRQAKARERGGFRGRVYLVATVTEE